MKKRVKKASFTIEAALLMTCLIPLLTALIYLGFFLHDRAYMQGEAYEQAVQAELQGEKKAVSLKKTFQVPGMTARFFGKSELQITAKAEMPVLDAKKKLLGFRAAKKLLQGDKT